MAVPTFSPMRPSSPMATCVFMYSPMLLNSFTMSCGDGIASSRAGALLLTSRRGRLGAQRGAAALLLTIRRGRLAFDSTSLTRGCGASKLDGTSLTQRCGASKLDGTSLTVRCGASKWDGTSLTACEALRGTEKMPFSRNETRCSSHRCTLGGQNHCRRHRDILTHAAY